MSPTVASIAADKPATSEFPEGVEVVPFFKKLPPDEPYPDFTAALRCAIASDTCYRTLPERVTAQSLVAEVKKQKKNANILLYDGADVFSTPTQLCVIYHNDYEIIVAFEGTHPLNLLQHQRNLLPYFKEMANAPRSFGKKAKVHEGFNRELDKACIRPDANGKPAPAFGKVKHTMMAWVGRNGKAITETETFWDAIKHRCTELRDEMPERKLYFTGHSAGGALATLAGARWLDEMKENKGFEGIYTFGQPRVGNAAFVSKLDKKAHTRYYRFELWKDPMPALPPPPADPYDLTGFEHTSTWFPMTLDGHALIIKNQRNRATFDWEKPLTIDEWEDRQEEPEIVDSRLGRFGRRLGDIVADSAAGRKTDTFRQRVGVVRARVKEVSEKDARDAHLVHNYCHAIDQYIQRVLNLASQAATPEEAAEIPPIATNARISLSVGEMLMWEMNVLYDSLEAARPCLNKDENGAAEIAALDKLQSCIESATEDWKKRLEHPTRNIATTLDSANPKNGNASTRAKIRFRHYMYPPESPEETQKTVDKMIKNVVHMRERHYGRKIQDVHRQLEKFVSTCEKSTSNAEPARAGLAYAAHLNKELKFFQAREFEVSRGL